MLFRSGMATAATVGAAEAAMAGLSPSGILRAAVAGAGAAGVKLVFDAVERKVAERALPLALSQDPNDLMILAKMVEKEPATSRVLEKLNSAMTVGAPQYEKAKERTGRATGGKVGRKTTAETLIAMANRARKKIQNDTKPILEEPDEIVVSALKVANKHI